ncbi:MAG TPA: 2-dehydropantoate 2-reductase [Candidatus Binataceae bacterium]|nr:2-dehydropantoate 2-reductase [Candidatus Binataceae bacterium]
MKICVFGAGAIGGFLAARLARAGAEVSVIARGPHLEAMRRNGLRLISAKEDFIVNPQCTSDPAEAGPQDYVILTLKAHSLPPAVGSIVKLLTPETSIVSAINGIPWWYFYKVGGPFDGTRVRSVDPDGSIYERLNPQRAIGCVVYPAAEVIEPGVIQHTYGDRFPIGEPDGAKSERCAALAQLMMAAGLKAPIRPRIRDDIWLKLWGNLSFNPISALTCATLDVIADDPGTRVLCRAMMLEAQAAAEKLGVRFLIDVDRRIDGGGEVGAHKTSMLQDLERGRPMEIDALLGAAVELARLVGVPTPNCDAVLALVRQRARLAGCYPEPAGTNVANTPPQAQL